MSIFNVLKSTGLPVAYSHFRTAVNPPFVVYTGNGQENFSADNTFYHSRNSYLIQYCYVKKNEKAEAAIEAALLAAGYQYEKSEDTFNQDADLFEIYYYV